MEEGNGNQVGKKEKTLEEKLEGLSDLERMTYDYIAKEPRNLKKDFTDTPSMLGAIGKLKGLGLVEFTKEYTRLDKFRVKLQKNVKIVE